ncbi:MAG: acyl phosphate:glycerol-3-phosphate acyltransferase [Actinomycetota bacterium]|nr:acyl phosphate:glycerol-3-phosphate acyltransferase [Actinomycetota bacterium]
MSDGLQIVVGVLVGYVIGMFPSADLVTRLATRGAVDLRASGSGNPGGLNAARVLGKKWGLLVIVLDTAKGALAGFVGLAFGDAGAYAAGTAVIAGHCWPVWNGFRGGKGVAAAGGSFAAVFPPMFPIDGLATLVVAAATRNSRLAIRAALVMWVVAAAVWWAADLSTWWGPEPGLGLLVYAVLGAGMIVVRFWKTDRAGGGSL